MTNTQDKDFYPDNYKECEICGVCSFAHRHKAGTKPNEFEVIEDEGFTPSCKNCAENPEQCEKRLCACHNFGIAKTTPPQDPQNTFREEVENTLKEEIRIMARMVKVMQPKTESELFAVTLPNLSIKVHELLHDSHKRLVEKLVGEIDRLKNLINLSHSVGSHSDDRGGDSDIECTCREQEQKYKDECYELMKKFINQTLK
jgi:hypothetical protein